MITDAAPHLTPHEVGAIQDALADRRRPGSYEPGKWSVSAYNREPKILGAAAPARYPERVEVRDITLRVIEQVPGVTLTLDQRRRIGEALLAAGIRNLEISAHGWRQRPEDLKSQIEHLQALRPDLEIKMGATMNESMIDLAADVGVTLAEFWIPSLPEVTPLYWSQAYKLAWEGEDWRRAGIPSSLTEAIEIGERLARRIVGRGLTASAGINLLTLVSDAHLEFYCRAMVEAGVEQLWLSDGSCGLAPEAWVHVVSKVRELAPDCKIGIYTRNAFGLAVANLVAATHAGAGVVEVSVNGIGAGAGLPDLAQVVAALEILYGVDTGVDLGQLNHLARLVEDVSGVRVSNSHAITGRRAHNWGGTEISVQELKVEPLLHYAFEPELVGGHKEWSLSITSGMWTLKDKLDELGLDVPPSEMADVMAEVLREIRVRGRSLSDDEVTSVVNRVGEAVPS